MLSHFFLSVIHLLQGCTGAGVDEERAAKEEKPNEKEGEESRRRAGEKIMKEKSKAEGEPKMIR